MAEAQMYDRISAGITFLSVEHGSIHAWINRIDLDKLDLYSQINCIIGQLYGTYKYELWTQYGAAGSYSGHPFGFDDENEDYAELTEAWRLVISGLRSVL